VKKLLTREIDSRESKVSADAVRRHLNEVRAMVSGADSALRAGNGRHEIAGMFHWGDHSAGKFCGNCLVYRRKDKPGYALAASVRWIDVDDDREEEVAFGDVMAGSDKESEDRS